MALIGEQGDGGLPAEQVDGLAHTLKFEEQGAAAPPTIPDFRPQAQPSWDRYEILGFLGAGGMGSVYKAQDRRLGRMVAIKFLRSDRLDARDPHQRRRFESEARAQARIEHPHICKIYDFGVVDGQPYIAMQFIFGSPLAELQVVLTREQKLSVIKQIAEALHAAHLQGVIHRDIKPAKVSSVAKSPTVFPALSIKAWEKFRPASASCCLAAKGPNQPLRCLVKDAVSAIKGSQPVSLNGTRSRSRT